MTNEELWQQVKDYTSILSENSRKLGFAGAAICWALRSSTFEFPDKILFALGFIVIFFIADIIQYFVTAILLRSWIYRQEAKRERDNKSKEDGYEKPRWLDYPAFSLWVIKVLTLLMGYSFIGAFLFNF